MFKRFRSWFWRKPNRPDDLLEYVGHELEGQTCSAYQAGISLTPEGSTIKKSPSGKYKYSAIGLSNFLPGLHKLEKKVAEALGRFWRNSRRVIEVTQAYYDEITLYDREHLEEALAFEESQRPLPKEKQVLVQEKYEAAKFDTQTTKVNAHAFSGEPRSTNLIRLVIVYATKYALCRLADRMRSNPLLWRVFSELEEPEYESIKKPIRTNMLASHTFAKHVFLWVCFIIALLPEYIILYHLGQGSLNLSGLGAYSFPLFTVIVCKLVAFSLRHLVRRHVKSRPKVPVLATTMCIIAFVVSVSYGYMTVVKTEENKSISQIESVKEKLARQEEALFMADVPTEGMKQDILKTKAQLEQLENDLYSDPYKSKDVSFLGLGLLSGLVLGANSIMLAFLTVAGKTAIYHRAMKRAKKEVIWSQRDYSDFLSDLNSARRLFLEFERLTLEASAIEQLRHCGPTEAELLESLPLQIKDLEDEYQSIINNKNKES